MTTDIQKEQLIVDDTIRSIEEIIDKLIQGKRRTYSETEQYIEEVRHKRVVQYERAVQEPYIGRLEVVDNDTELSYRIGKVAVVDSKSENIIYDWRTPIGDVYYGFSGGDGKVTYAGPEDDQHITINRKREVQIRNQKVLHVRDYVSSTYRSSNSSPNEPELDTLDDHTMNDTMIDVKDPFLLDLWMDRRNDHQMREIIATIQKEQNDLIRLGMARPILVQGVAGSGKTSIALHRISYLLYQYHEQLSADRILVLAPNDMFLQYIKDVVKELDIEGIQQFTVIGLASKLLPFIRSIKTQQQWLTEDIDTPDSDMTTRSMQKYVTSLSFFNVVEQLLELISDNYLPKEFPDLPYYLTDSVSVQQKFQEIYNGYRHLPLNKRRMETSKSIRNWMDFELKKQKKLIEDQYFKTKREWVDELPEALVLKKELEDKLKEAHDFKIASQEGQWRQEIKRYLDAWKPLQVMSVLEQVYSANTLKSLVPDIEEDILRGLQGKVALLKQRNVSFEDIGPLLLIEQRLNGGEYSWDYLVIDEAQDLNPFLLKVLKSTTRSIMMLGDITQSIYDSTGFEDWTELHQVFGEELHEMQLTISYRSTEEIMALANHIVQQLEAELPELHPVHRHGEKPTLIPVTNGLELIDSLGASINELLEAGYERIAVIPKDMKLCRLLYTKLKDMDSLSIQLVEDTNAELKSPIIFIPAPLVKGLEFDAVIIPNANSRTYHTEHDGKLLFVSVTRAQVALQMLYYDEPSRFINNCEALTIRSHGGYVHGRA